MPRVFIALFLILIAVPGLISQQPATVDVTVHEGTSMAIALSPDKQTLVLDLQGGLWTLPATGGTATRVTDEYGDARQPSWSPDGRRIAYQGYRDGTWRIWSMAANGSDAKALTSGSFDDREPHWSPDGTRIAFSSDRSGNYDVWVLDVASGQVRQITRDPANDFFPAWSNDSRELLFVSNRSTAPGVYAATLDGKERLVHGSNGSIGAPVWTADGKALFSVLPGGGFNATGRTSLMLGAQELADDEDYFPFKPQWLSNDEFLYTADGQIKRRSLTRGATGTIAFTATLKVAPPIYTRKKRDFDSTAPQPVKGIIRPTISPDGTQLAFAALGDIWTMPLSPPGTAPIRLANDEFVDTDPAWSPDGTRLPSRQFAAAAWTSGSTTSRPRPSAACRCCRTPTPRRRFRRRQVDFVHQQRRLRAERGLHRPSGGWRAAQDPGPDVRRRLSLVVARQPLRDYAVVQAVLDPLSRGNELLQHRAVGQRRIAHRRPRPRFTDRQARRRWTRLVAGRTPDRIRHQRILVRNAGVREWRSDWPATADHERADRFDQLGRIEPDPLHGHRSLEARDVASRSVKDIPVNLTWQRRLPTGRTVVHAGRLIDGKQATARPDVDVVIEGHRIRSVEPHRAELHTGTVVDASGASVMPGLIEGHGHQLKEDGLLFGRVHLAYGVTTVRSPGGVPYEGLEDREAMESGKRIGPRIFMTGYLLDGWRPYYPIASTAPTEAVVDMEVERARRLDYDLIKTYVRLPDLLQRRAIEGAHRIGIPTSSHEIYPAGLSGSDSVEHTGATSRRGYSPKQSGMGRSYEDVIQIIAKSKMTITPTIALGGYQAAIASDPSIAQDPRMTRLQPAWAQPGAGGGGRAAAAAAPLVRMRSDKRFSVRRKR